MLKIAFVKIIVTAGMICYLVSCKEEKKWQSLPYYVTPEFTPYFLADKPEALQRNQHTITGFAFNNQDGKLVSDKNISGKIHVASFIFTTCGSICPMIVENLKMVQSAFAGDTNIVQLSFSVMP